MSCDRVAVNRRLRRSLSWLMMLGTILCFVLSVSVSIARAEKGLPSGVSVPAWAKGQDIHFDPKPANDPLGKSASILGAQPLIGGSSGPLVYHEGPANEPVAVTLIFWGSNWTETALGREVRKKIQEALTVIHYELGEPLAEGEESYQGILGEYWGQYSHIAWVGKGIQGLNGEGKEMLPTREIADTHPGAAPSKISDTSILAELERLHETEHINGTEYPKEYFIVLPAPGSTYAVGFDEEFCGYHTYTEAGTGKVSWAYGLVPYQGDEPFAAEGCNYLNEEHPEDPVDRTTKTLAREYADGITDPKPGKGWMTATGEQEVADLCTKDPFEEKTPDPKVWVQELYDNIQGTCAKYENFPPQTWASDGGGEVTTTEAKFFGGVDPGGTETKYHFQYGLEANKYTNSTSEVSAGSGYEGKEVSQLVTGLKSSTTYHDRIVATSRVGNFYGQDTSVTTGPFRPSISIQPGMNELTETEATVYAYINPGDAETHYKVEYGPTSSYGSTTAEADAGSGNKSILEHVKITGLKKGTVYHYQFVATNSVGSENTGLEWTFTTEAHPPKASIESASSVSRTEATLNGIVNPEGVATKYHFEYGMTEAYGTSAPATPAEVGSGESGVKVSQKITGLLEHTLYHFRLSATNIAGTTNTSDGTFRTTAVPSVEYEATSNVSKSGIHLHANVNPQGLETTYKFEYGKTTSYGTSIPFPSASVGAGTSPVQVTQTLSGLEEATTYHYRIVATNSLGTTNGSDQTFMTRPWAPVVTTTAATSLGKTSATLNGTVNPESGEVTECYFQYGTTVSYGMTIRCSSSPGSGEAPVNVSATPTGLTESTAYHYRLVAKNKVGTTYGNDEQFATYPYEPTVETLAPVTNPTETTAEFRATVNPNDSTVTECEFDWGEAASYGKTVVCGESPGSGTIPVYVSAKVSGLKVFTAYHYRIVATNSLGTKDGADHKIRTEGGPECAEIEAEGEGPNSVFIKEFTAAGGDWENSCRNDPTINWAETSSGTALASWGAFSGAL